MTNLQRDQNTSAIVKTLYGVLLWQDVLSLSGEKPACYPGTLRGTKEWDSTYKIRVNVEKSINHFRTALCCRTCKNQNEKTLHADLLPAGITQLIVY